MNANPPRCFSTLGCPELSLDQVLQLAVEFEIPQIEIRALEDRMDIPELLLHYPNGWAGVRRQLDSNGLRVRALGTSFRLTDWGDANWNELLRFGELANALDVPYLRVFGGGHWGTPTSEAGFENAGNAARRWNEERESRNWGVELLLETHDAFSGSPQTLELLEKISTPLGVLWDCHHTWRLGGETPEASWTALGPHVKHVHFKDGVGSPSGNHPYTYTLPGWGDMPFQDVLTVLHRDGYAGAMSLEWEKKWHPYLDPLPDALRACRKAGWW